MSGTKLPDLISIPNHFSSCTQSHPQTRVPARRPTAKYDFNSMRARIWEIDETLSKSITYDEFELMYQRVRSDRTGLEPRTMYNLVDFMMVFHDVS